jgi:hypothetical protein
MNTTAKRPGDTFTRTVAKRQSVDVWGHNVLPASHVVTMLRSEHRAALRIVNSWVLGDEYTKNDYGRGYMSALNDVRDSLTRRAT